MALLNPDLEQDPTYLWGSKRIDLVLVSPALAGVAVKAGHHNFNQHFVSDHKGIFIQFKAADIFDTATMDKSHASYRRLRMGRRDIVDKYITHLVGLYQEHHVWTRAEKLATRMIAASSESVTDKYFDKFDKLDQERIRYMRSAENFAGLPPPNGVYEWSPLLEKSGRTVTYWKLRLNLVRTQTHTSDRIDKLFPL